MITSGSMNSSRIAMTASTRVGRMKASIKVPPIIMIVLLSPTERLEPTTACTSVVSPVSRDKTSPVWSVSKNAGRCRSTLAYTALRKSVVIRSPSQLTM
jgi:hypothetical protein